MVPVRIGWFVLASVIVQRPPANLIWHPALSNLEMERRETFDEGMSMVFLSEILLMAPLSSGDFAQIVAVPCPDDEIDPSPKPVILFLSSVSRKSKSDCIVRMCDIIPESMIIGVRPLAMYAWDALVDFDELVCET